MSRKRTCCESIDAIMMGQDGDDSIAYRSCGGYKMAVADEYSDNTAKYISFKRNVVNL